MDPQIRRALENGGQHYRIAAASGTMAASLTANQELFQFRFVSATKLCLVRKVMLSFGSNVAASTAALAQFRMTTCRAWTVAGSGGTRLTLTGNNGKLRTSYDTTSVNDAGISTTAGLTAGTKTADTTDSAMVAFGVGTGAITTSTVLGQTRVPLWDKQDSPLVYATQEGFIIRNAAALPAGMTWHFGVDVEYSEIPAGAG